MSTIKLRKEVINSLATADEHFLRIVYELYKKYKSNEKATFDELPLEIQDLILQSRESVKKGHVFSHKNVMEESKRKYNVNQ